MIRNHIADEQAGFTLTEVLIVMAIVGILMAVAVPSFMGTKDTARKKAAATYAASYQRVIAAYQMDHGRLVPPIEEMPVKEGLDYPDPCRTAPTKTKAGLGPLNLLCKPYLKEGRPDMIDHQTMQFCTSTCSGSDSTAFTRITYRPTLPDRLYYDLLVESRTSPSKAWEKYCHLGTDITASSGVKTC